MWRATVFGLVSFLLTLLTGLTLIACGSGGGGGGGGSVPSPQPAPERDLVSIQGRVATLPAGVTASELRAYTLFSQALPAPDGTFTVDAPPSGVQVVSVCSPGDERLLAGVSVNNQALVLDAMSTAVSLVFEAPGITVLDAARAEQVLQRIRALPETTQLAAAIEGRLQGDGSREQVAERRASAVRAYLGAGGVAERASPAANQLEFGPRSGLSIVSQAIERPGVLELVVQNDHARFVDCFDSAGTHLGRLSSKHFVGLLDARQGPERKTLELAIGEHRQMSLLAYGPGMEYGALDPRERARAREAALRTIVFDFVLPSVGVFAGVGSLIRDAPETLEEVLSLIQAQGHVMATLDGALAHGDWLAGIKAVVDAAFQVLQDHRGLIHQLLAELGVKRVAAWAALLLTFAAEVWQVVSSLGQLWESVYAWNASLARESWLVINEPPGLGVDPQNLRLTTGESATLTARGADPEQMEVTWTWRQVSGAPLELDGTSGKQVRVRGVARPPRPCWSSPPRTGSTRPGRSRSRSSCRGRSSRRRPPSPPCRPSPVTSAARTTRLAGGST